MNVKILGNKIIIEYPKEEAKSTEMKKSPGGILLPDVVERNPHTTDVIKKTKVIRAGIDCKNVKTGDIIYFDKRVALEVVLDDDKYIMITEENVLGVKE